MKVIFLLSIFVLNQYVYADFGPGNGGDKVYCEKTKEGNEIGFEGHYFLDFIVAQMNNKNEIFFENVEEFYINLKYKIPSLAEQFEKMLTAYRGQAQNGPYVWKKATPLELNDENLIFELPINCQGSLKQVIRRNRYNPSRVYLWYSEDLKTLESQISWVIMHEVLWDYFETADEVRLVNEFLHKRSYVFLDSRDYIEEFNKVASPQKFMNYELYINLKQAKKDFLELKKTDASVIQADVSNHTGKVTDIIVYCYQLIKLTFDDHERRMVLNFVGEMNEYQYNLRKIARKKKFFDSRSNLQLNYP